MLKLGRSIVLVGSYGLIQLLAFVAAGFAPVYLARLPTFDIEAAPIISSIVAATLIYLASITLASIVKWLLHVAGSSQRRYRSRRSRPSHGLLSSLWFALSLLALIALFMLLTWMLAYQYALDNALISASSRLEIWAIHSLSLGLLSLDAALALRYIQEE